MRSPIDDTQKFTCQCGVVLKAPKSAAGTTANCPACGSGLIVPGVMDSFILYDYGNTLEEAAMPLHPDNIATQIVEAPQNPPLSEADAERNHAEEILRLLDRRQSEDATRTATVDDVRPARAVRKKRAKRPRKKTVHRRTGASPGMMLALLAAMASSLVFVYLLLQR